MRVRAAAAEGSIGGARELDDALTRALALAATPVAAAAPLVPDGQPPPLLLGELGAHAFGHLARLLATMPDAPAATRTRLALLELRCAFGHRLGGRVAVRAVDGQRTISKA